MSRTRVVGVPFNKVTAKDLTGQFFEDNPNPLEKTIEQVYVGQTAYATSGFVLMKAFCTDDGRADFKYGSKNETKFSVYSEVLRNVNPTECNILKKLLQSFHYHWQGAIKPISPPKRKIVGFMIVGSKFFAFIPMTSVLHIIDKLVPLFETTKCSASKTWDVSDMKNIMKDAYEHGEIDCKIYEYSKDLNFRLDKVYHDLYLQYLD